MEQKRSCDKVDHAAPSLAPSLSLPSRSRRAAADDARGALVVTTETKPGSSRQGAETMTDRVPVFFPENQNGVGSSTPA